MIEVWKPLVGKFDGWPYEVSDRGRVRRCGRRVRKLTPNQDGYPCLNLSHLGVVRFARAHRLVAEAFLGLPTGDQQVNHIDGHKENNHVSNLEWVTCRENIHHAERIGLRKFLPLGRYQRKLSDEQVRAIRELTRRGLQDTFLARWFGVSQPTVRNVRIGVTYLDVA